MTTSDLGRDAINVLALLAGTDAPIQPARFICGVPPKDGRTRAHKAWVARMLAIGLGTELELHKAGLITDESMDGHPNPHGYGWGYVITDAGREALEGSRP